MQCPEPPRLEGPLERGLFSDQFVDDIKERVYGRGLSTLGPQRQLVSPQLGALGEPTPQAGAALIEQRAQLCKPTQHRFMAISAAIEGG